jgi:arabinan endo-1,5-alpha-L-arabinosidase
MREAALLAALVLTLTMLAGSDADASRPRPGPVTALTGGKFADPSVVRYSGGYVGVATGARVRRAVAPSPEGPWDPAPAALLKLPRWATTGGIWAPDLVRAGGGWLLYYSAVLRRDATKSQVRRRCVGVAAARRALDAFRPVGRRPLVCPRTGAIDPSAFGRDPGRRYLLFRTQGLPASIRMVRLTADGRHVARRARPLTLVRSTHAVENPVLVRHGEHLVLFSSERSWRGCSYRTTWRRSRQLFDWRHARSSVLMDTGTSGLCGPGGADVLALDPAHEVVYFHGWVCGNDQQPCPRDFLVRGLTAIRVMYGAELTWQRGLPGLGEYYRR